MSIQFRNREHAAAMGLADAWDADQARERAKAAALPPGRWEIVIAGWTPPSLNKVLWSHWAKVARIKKEAETEIEAGCLFAGVKRAARKRRVTMTVTIHRGRCGLDDDNAWKAVLDGLVKAGAL